MYVYIYTCIYIPTYMHINVNVDRVTCNVYIMYIHIVQKNDSSSRCGDWQKKKEINEHESNLSCPKKSMFLVEGFDERKKKMC